MGWASGTRLFDDVLDAIFKIHTHDTVALVKSVEAVIKAFESFDCDTLLETKHDNSAVFVQAWVNVHPDYRWSRDEHCLVYIGDIK